MRLHLVDIDEDLVEAWQEAFRELPEVTIHHDHILAVAENCVVSASNSHGWMDGGIDAVYRSHFGKQLEQALQEAIAKRSDKLLPVGEALVVRTGDHKIPFMIAAPTMREPGPTGSPSVLRAMKAVLRVADADPEVGREVYCPGLGTGVGTVAPHAAASAMAGAYRDWKRSL